MRFYFDRPHFTLGARLTSRAELMSADKRPTRLSSEHSKNALRAWLLLLKTCNEMERFTNTRLQANYQTSLSRFDVLANLDQAGGSMSIGQLAKKLIASSGNISRLLDRMIEDDLIERHPNPADRRVNDVSLTRSGRALFRKMARDHENWVDHIFGATANEDIAELLRHLASIRDNIERAEDIPQR